MFAKSIVTSDAFCEMPASARCLYFMLGMFADDDGFVNSPRAIMRQSVATDDDMKLLIAKRFVLVFEDGVIVIKHWRMHNYIQKDRYKETTYKKHRDALTLDKSGTYHLAEEGVGEPLPAEKTECIQNVYIPDTQVRLGKVRLGKDSIGESAGAYAHTREEPKNAFEALLEEKRNEERRSNGDNGQAGNGVS